MLLTVPVVWRGALPKPLVALRQKLEVLQVTGRNRDQSGPAIFAAAEDHRTVRLTACAVTGRLPALAPLLVNAPLDQDMALGEDRNQLLNLPGAVPSAGAPTHYERAPRMQRRWLSARQPRGLCPRPWGFWLRPLRAWLCFAGRQGT